MKIWALIVANNLLVAIKSDAFKGIEPARFVYLVIFRGRIAYILPNLDRPVSISYFGSSIANEDMIFSAIDPCLHSITFAVYAVLLHRP